MRLCRDRPLTRIIGSLVGLGFLVVGVFSLIGGHPDLPSGVRQRAAALGATFVTVGLLAILASLTARDLDNVWCRHPRRLGRQPPRS